MFTDEAGIPRHVGMPFHSNNLWVEKNPGDTLQFKHQHTLPSTRGQAVSRRILTAGAQIQSQIFLCGMYGEQNGTAQTFGEKFGFQK
jgi:hypothetical protein